MSDSLTKKLEHVDRQITILHLPFSIRHPRPSSPSAFTLIELMISIALVLLLILGVNQVFTYTTQAVGAGQAINASIRDSRAFGACAANDFNGMVGPSILPNGSASLIISSSQIFAFRDRRDQQGDLDGFANTRDLNNDKKEGDSSVPGEIIQPWQYNYRNHRTDVLSFFSRDNFNRQTGNLGTIADSLASQEAWIWYGHLWLPDNAGNYFFTDPTTGQLTPTFPGRGSSVNNPNNLYATQFVLGRMAILLQNKNPTSNTIQDSAGFNQRFIDGTPYSPSLPATDLQPLCANALSSTLNGDAVQYLLQDSRFDLAATSISDFRNKLMSYAYRPTPSPGNIPPLANPNVASSVAWWDQMMDGNPNTKTPGLSPQSITPVNGESVSTRFKCNPFVSKPMTADTLAQAAPYCLGGCGQFIVEYAGDYLKQNNVPGSVGYGGIIPPTLPATTTGDGQIDYVLIGTGAQQRKQIIWYGLPRNTSGLSGLSGQQGDVVPLYLWTGTPQSFEHVLPSFTSQGVASSMQSGSQYICGWGPYDKKPMLIRITITLDDPTGRLPEGQTFQYVFPVPQNP